MAFGSFDNKAAGQTMSEINMVPLIDVMLVLLVIFIITAPLLTHSIKVDVPRVSAHGEAEGMPYSVMELLDGLSVDRYACLVGGCLRAPDALEIIDRLLDVLVVAHARGIIHRDIKPSNLFRTRAPARLKVLDFGIAGGMRHPNEVSPLTAAGTMLGTPHFMAPEHASGHWDEVDAQSDLWSVGATLFKLPLERLSLYIGANNPITEEAAAECVVRVRTTTVWELVSAVGERDAGRALGALEQVYEPQDRGLRRMEPAAGRRRMFLVSNVQSVRTK